MDSTDKEIAMTKVRQLAQLCKIRQVAQAQQIECDEIDHLILELILDIKCAIERL